IQPVLALPLGYIKGNSCGAKVWFVHQDNLLDVLAPEDGPKKLNAGEINRVVTAMEMLQQSSAKVHQRPR
ncbi:MAG TPA: hypothetical protein VL282_10195, partial [Tepidisphaeraceae bacterium]|nr:hypothetical protein [Tepidisphaeraceae bacterium]